MAATWATDSYRARSIEARRDRANHARALYESGVSIKQIAEDVGVESRTVQMYLRTAVVTERLRARKLQDAVQRVAAQAWHPWRLADRANYAAYQRRQKLTQD